MTRGHPVITRCQWVPLALAGHSAGCRRVLLPIPRMPQSTCCELRFSPIPLVTFSLFLSLSTIHRYTLQTSALSKTPSPFSTFVRIGPYPLPPPCGRPLWMTPNSTGHTAWMTRAIFHDSHENSQTFVRLFRTSRCYPTLRTFPASGNPVTRIVWR